jgi:ubiquinone/menaquinone biosynthesis C-methylase UbiE
VLAAYSLIHIPTADLPRVLGELHRVLQRGGLLLTIGQSGEPDHIEDEPLAAGERVFVNFLTPGRLREALESAHFRVELLATKPASDDLLMSEGVIWALAGRN